MISKQKTEIFSIISLIVYMILYAVFICDIIGNWMINVDNIIDIYLNYYTHMILVMTLVQIVSLAIVYLGVPLFISLMMIIKRKSKHIVTVVLILYFIIALVFSIIAYIISLYLSIERSPFMYLWTYILSFIWTILLFIYNLIRKEG